MKCVTVTVTEKPPEKPKIELSSIVIPLAGIASAIGLEKLAER